MTICLYWFASMSIVFPLPNLESYVSESESFGHQRDSQPQNDFHLNLLDLRNHHGGCLSWESRMMIPMAQQAAISSPRPLTFWTRCCRTCMYRQRQFSTANYVKRYWLGVFICLFVSTTDTSTVSTMASPPEIQTGKNNQSMIESAVYCCCDVVATYCAFLYHCGINLQGAEDDKSFEF
jgi:hypothetical protein